MYYKLNRICSNIYVFYEFNENLKLSLFVSVICNSMRKIDPFFGPGDYYRELTVNTK